MPKKSIPRHWTEVPKSLNFRLSDYDRKVLFFLFHTGYGATAADCYRKAMNSNTERLGIDQKIVQEFIQDQLLQKNSSGSENSS